MSDVVIINTKDLRTNAMSTALGGIVRVELKLLLEVLDQHDRLLRALSEAQAPHKRNCTTPYLDQGGNCPCGIGELLILARFLK